ncbi:MAG: hypothetical protein DHS20C18_23270 [Saprospiraceae bacterium]|nr:MAG: hypothetical protein DHS20C18_23270 [Saprospiraceae bacterium]
MIILKKYKHRLFLVLLCFIPIANSIAQNRTTTITLNDTSVLIITNNDTIILKTDTAEVIQGLPALPLNNKAEENIGPKNVLKIFSTGKIFWSIIFITFTYFLIKLTSNILTQFAEKSAAYRITIKGFIPIFRVFGWILTIYIIIQGIIQPPVETVIAVTASVGIAVGFASQDIFKNIFGGLIIIFDQPFKVGDKIEVGQFYGEVIEIGLRSTRIVTPDDSVVSIPNGEMMNQSVSNANVGEANCQVVAEIYLPITIPVKEVRRIAFEAAQVSKYIYLNKPITVLFFNEVKERRSYLKMRLKAYVSDIRDEFAFKSDMTELVIQALIEKKIINPEELL